MTDASTAEYQTTIQPPTGRFSSILRPSFEKIISGFAVAPYDFESLVEFLSHNHCIETLDFLSEAKYYSGSYLASEPSIREQKMTPNTRHLGKQWETIMSTYISIGSPHELNIPENIRTAVLRNHNVLKYPPRPTELDSTIHHARELLSEGVLSFVNDVQRIRKQHPPSHSLSDGIYSPSRSLQVASEAGHLSNQSPK